MRELIRILDVAIKQHMVAGLNIERNLRAARDDDKKLFVRPILLRHDDGERGRWREGNGGKEDLGLQRANHRFSIT